MRQAHLVLVAFAVGLALVGATAASARDTMCTGALGAVTINGNVVAGPGCDLTNTTVRGNVKVAPGGSLTIGSASTTTISGDVVANKARVLLIQSGTIGGNFDAGHGATDVVLDFAKISGNVRVHDNDGSDPTGRFGNVVVSADTVGGSVVVEHNSATGSFSNDITVGDNGGGGFKGSISGDVRVDRNVTRGGTLDNRIRAFSNVVGGNLQFDHNSASGSDEVWANVIEKTLACDHDAPPTIDENSPNTAAKKTGECASL